MLNETFFCDYWQVPSSNPSEGNNIFSYPENCNFFLLCFDSHTWILTCKLCKNHWNSCPFFRVARTLQYFLLLTSVVSKSYTSKCDLPGLETWETRMSFGRHQTCTFDRAYGHLFRSTMAACLVHDRSDAKIPLKTPFLAIVYNTRKSWLKKPQTMFIYQVHIVWKLLKMSHLSF